MWVDPYTIFWEIWIQISTSFYTMKENRFIHVSMWDEGWERRREESKMTLQRTVSMSMQLVLSASPLKCRCSTKAGRGTAQLCFHSSDSTGRALQPSAHHHYLLEQRQSPSHLVQTSNIECSWSHWLKWSFNESFEPCPQKIVIQSLELFGYKPQKHFWLHKQK